MKANEKLEALEQEMCEELQKQESEWNHSYGFDVEGYATHLAEKHKLPFYPQASKHGDGDYFGPNWLLALVRGCVALYNEDEF